MKAIYLELRWHFRRMFCQKKDYSSLRFDAIRRNVEMRQKVYYNICVLCGIDYSFVKCPDFYKEACKSI
jgi:hypothetical protein